MKDIAFTQHALDQLTDRGTSVDEIEMTIRQGESSPARHGRLAYRKNFNFECAWKGKRYRYKQVVPIVAEEPECVVVITVYVFYFGGD